MWDYGNDWNHDGIDYIEPECLIDNENDCVILGLTWTSVLGGGFCSENDSSSNNFVTPYISGLVSSLKISLYFGFVPTNLYNLELISFNPVQAFLLDSITILNSSLARLNPTYHRYLNSLYFFEVQMKFCFPKRSQTFSYLQVFPAHIC